MNKRLFIDDERFPPDDGQEWVIVRSSKEAIGHCILFGCPEYISFDHDLGGEDKDTAMIFVKWLIEADLDRTGCFIPENFSFYVHSQNVNGRDNIKGLIESYLKHRTICKL